MFCFRHQTAAFGPFQYHLGGFILCKRMPTHWFRVCAFFLNFFFDVQLVLESKLHETTELSDKVTILDEKVAGAQEDCKGYLSMPWV